MALLEIARQIPVNNMLSGIYNALPAGFQQLIPPLQSSILAPDVAETALNTLYFLAPKRKIPFVLLDAKVDVLAKNNIIKTSLTGRSGTVKERVSADDCKVTVTGNLVGLLSNYTPLDMLALLVQCMKEEGFIYVASKTLLPFGIFRLALDNYEVKQSTAKHVNTLPVTMIFWSDQEVKLE
jgi:hypothetical protein